jgi:hypothetical protein
MFQSLEFLIQDPYTWSTAAGYQILELNEFFNDVNFDATDFIDAPQSVVEAGILHSLQSSRSPMVIWARDVTVLQWSWISDFNQSRFSYFFLSKTNGILSSSPDYSSIWLKYYPFVAHCTIDKVSLALSDHTPLRYVNQSNYPVFAGGDLQFGHWVSDTLYKFLLYKIDGISNVIICNQLTSYYLSALRYIYSSESILPNVLQLPLPNANLEMLHFNKLAIPVNFPLAARYALVRSRLPTPELNIRPSFSAYLYRGTRDGVARIANEDDILSKLLDRNIIILRPETFSFADAHKFYASIKHMIIPHGGSTANVNLFSPMGTRMTYLYPSSFDNLTPEIIQGAAYFLVPWIRNTKLIRSEVTSTTMYNNPVPQIVVPVENLCDTIDKLKEQNVSTNFSESNVIPEYTGTPVV